MNLSDRELIFGGKGIVKDQSQKQKPSTETRSIKRCSPIYKGEIRQNREKKDRMQRQRSRRRNCQGFNNRVDGMIKIDGNW